MKKYFLRIYYFLKQKPLYALTLIICVQLLVISYYSAQKKNFHIDEIVTLRVSNDHQLVNIFYYPQNKFIASQELKNSLKIEGNERFHYGSVYKHSKLDKGVPPLYYLLLHTAYSVYSFFSDNFSMWPGIVLNMIFFTFASIVFYFVSRFIFDPVLALLPNLLWGFSAGAINSVFFMRMYVLATLLYLLLLYISFNIIRNKNASLKDFVFLSFIVYFGILTHYHFVVWVFLVMAFYCIAMYRYSISIIFKSSVSVLLAVVLSILSFPVTSNALNSGHKKWFSENFLNFGHFFKRLFSFFDFYMRTFWGINASITVFLICVLLIIVIIRKIFFSADTVVKQPFDLKQDVMSKITNNHIFVFFTALSFLFIIIIAYTSQHRAERYIWPIAPGCIIFSLFLIKFAIYKYQKARIKRITFILTVIVFVILGFVFGKKFAYLYSNDESYHKSLEYGSLNAICMSKYLGDFTHVVYPLLNCKYTIFMDTYDEHRLAEILNNFQKEKEALIMLAEKSSENQYNDKVFQLIKQFGWETELFFRVDRVKVYIIRYIDIQ
jgi:hypothetical protein